MLNAAYVITLIVSLEWVIFTGKHSSSRKVPICLLKIIIGMQQKRILKFEVIEVSHFRIWINTHLRSIV